MPITYDEVEYILGAGELLGLFGRVIERAESLEQYMAANSSVGSLLAPGYREAIEQAIKAAKHAKATITIFL